MANSELERRFVQAFNDEMVRVVGTYIRSSEIKTEDSVGRRCLKLEVPQNEKQILVEITDSSYYLIRNALEKRKGTLDNPPVVSGGPGYVAPHTDGSTYDRLSANVFEKDGKKYLRLNYTDIGVIGTSLFVRFDQGSQTLLRILSQDGIISERESPYAYFGLNSQISHSLRQRIAMRISQENKRPEYFNISNLLFGSAVAQNAIPSPSEKVAGTKELSILHSEALNALNKLQMQDKLRDSVARILLAEMAARARYFTKILNDKNSSKEEKAYAGEQLGQIANDYVFVRLAFEVSGKNFVENLNYKKIRNRYLDANANPINRPTGMLHPVYAQSEQRIRNA